MRSFVTLALAALAVVPSALAAPAPQAISKNAQCGSAVGLTCRGSTFGNCCSQYGYCGSSSDYCGKGCQAGFGNCDSTTSPVTQPKVSQDGRCGGSKGETCKGSQFGDCCSTNGWCGSSNAYCRAGCQPLFGDCKGTTSPSPSPAPVASRTTSTAPSATQKVSNNARCGSKFGAFPQGQTCRGSKFGNCCSDQSYCGSTAAYCGTGCQPGFGDCDAKSSSVASSTHVSSSSVSSAGIPTPSSSVVVSSSSSVVSSSAVSSSAVVSSSIISSTIISSSAVVSSSVISSSAVPSSSSSLVSSSAISSSVAESSSVISSSVVPSSSSAMPSASPTPEPQFATCATPNVALGLQCGVGSFTATGRIQIFDADSSASLGYLNNNQAQSGGYMFNLDTLANALVVSFTYTAPDCINTKITDLALSLTNAVGTNTAYGTYLGGVGGSGGYSNMGPGRVDYAYTGQTSLVAADTPAQQVPTGASALGYNGPAEASIWNVDIGCGDLTSTWTNNDLSQITTVTFLDYALCASGCILLGGDQAKFQSTFPGEQLKTVKLKFVPGV